MLKFFYPYNPTPCEAQVYKILLEFYVCDSEACLRAKISLKLFVSDIRDKIAKGQTHYYYLFRRKHGIQLILESNIYSRRYIAEERIVCGNTIVQV